VVNSADEMQLCSTAELLDVFSDYFDADKEYLENAGTGFLVNDKSTDTDIDFDHPSFTNPGAAAAAPKNTRAVLGGNSQAYDTSAMISTD